MKFLAVLYRRSTGKTSYFRSPFRALIPSGNRETASLAHGQNPLSFVRQLNRSAAW